MVKGDGFISLKKSLVNADKNLNIEVGKTISVVKTLKCGIYTGHENMKNSNFTKLLTPKQFKELNYYIDTFEEKRREILKDYYQYYEKGVYDFLIHCARIKDTKMTVYESIKYIPEQKTTIKKHDGSYLKVKAYRTKNVKKENYNKTLSWVTIDKNTEDGCERVIVNYEDKKLNAGNYKDYLKENKLDENKFSLTISSKSINSRLSFFYLTGANYFDKYKKEIGVEIKSILDNSKINSPQFKEPLGMKIAGNIDSFAKKLLERISDVDKAFENKNRIIDELLNKNEDFPKYFAKKVTRRQESFMNDFKVLEQDAGDLKDNSRQFNILAKEYNVIANNFIQAYLSDYDKNENIDYDDVYKKLREKYIIKALKDIPAFPLHEEELKKENIIMENEIIDYVKLKTIKADFTSFKKYEFDKCDFVKIKEMEEDEGLTVKAKWMQVATLADKSFIFYMYNSFMRKKNAVKNKIYYYFYHLVITKSVSDQEKIINEIVKFLVDKMKKITPHLRNERFHHDGQTKRIFADSARMIILFIAQSLKDNEKTEKARKLELEIDDKLGIYKGNVFDNFKKKETSILSFSGFNFDEKGTKKGVTLVFENKPVILKPGNKKQNKLKRGRGNFKTSWYLAINLYEQIKFTGDNIVKNRILDYEPNKFFSLSVKGNKEKENGILQVKELHENTFSENSNIILLPLLLGKRQVREYINNFDFSTLDSAKTFFSSIEILRERENNFDQYYMCLATTRSNIIKKTLPANKCYGYVGVDRGEKTVAWAALVNQDGNPLLPKKNDNFFELGANFKEKYDKKYREIAESQSRGGIKKLKIKGEISKLIESIGADIISLALKYGIKIVIENLSTSFGRKGKGVYVAVAQQYGNLERFIEAKLTQNNIWKSGKEGIIQTVPASYTSKMCSNCGNINSMRNKESIVDNILKIYGESGGLNKKIQYKDWNLDLDQVMETWDKKERKIISINVYDKILEILTNKKIKEKYDVIKRQISKLLFPRKDDSEKYKCNFCGHTCNADKQAALNIARFYLIPTRTEAERKKMTTIEKLESVYQRKLKTKVFKPGSEIL